MCSSLKNTVHNCMFSAKCYTTGLGLVETLMSASAKYDISEKIQITTRAYIVLELSSTKISSEYV